MHCRAHLPLKLPAAGMSDPIRAFVGAPTDDMTGIPTVPVQQGAKHGMLVEVLHALAKKYGRSRDALAARALERGSCRP